MRLHRSHAGLLSLALTILLQVVGSIILFQFKCNIISLIAITSISTLLVFTLISHNNIRLLLKVLKSNICLVTLLNLCVMLMLVTLYFCVMHGISPARYLLLFAATMGLLSSFENKNLWFLGFVVVIINVLMLSDWSFLMILSMLGPVGTYFTLKIAGHLKNQHNLSLANVMVLRYALSGIMSLIALPWLPALTTQSIDGVFLSSLAFIVIGMNILPMFFSQLSSLLLGHRSTAMGFATLPFITFISERFYLKIYHPYFIAISIVMLILVYVSIRWPIIRSNTLSC